MSCVRYTTNCRANFETPVPFITKIGAFIQTESEAERFAGLGTTFSTYSKVAGYEKTTNNERKGQKVAYSKSKCIVRGILYDLCIFQIDFIGTFNFRLNKT